MSKNNGMLILGQMEASGAGVYSSPISEHIHNALWSWGDHVGLALSCFISNGRLPGDSACQPPEPQFFSQVPYGRPSPIPLAGPEQR